MNTNLLALGIKPEMLIERGLVVQQEALELVLAEVDNTGREFFLTPACKQAWLAMKQAARQDGVDLLMMSAFRSVARQCEIIEAKLAQGESIATILQQCAPPGYSEHHTGRAIDITTPDEPELEISFEHTAAFTWLTEHAADFGFSLSYPRGNATGFQYEPWHWCFHPSSCEEG